MRTLTAELEAAQRAANKRPYLKATISDRLAGIRRFRPSLWYSGAEAAGPHAAAVPTDGSLNRLRIDGTTLYRQRVTTPTSGSTYSSWTSFRTTTKLCALAGYGANLAAFAVDSATPTQIHVAISGDNGATWGAFALAITHAVTINCIAATAKSNGDFVVVVNNGNNISAYKYTAGAWGAAVTTTDGAITPAGLAIFRSGDYNVMVTGVTPSTTASNLAQRIFGDGFSQAANTWSTAYATILASAAGSNVAYAAPFAAKPDVARVTFRETFSGTGAYDRIAHAYQPASADFSLNLWREPAPLNVDADYGLALSYTATTCFVTAANLVYGWSLTPASVDVSGDVLRAEIHEEPFSLRPSTIELTNAAATYLPLPSAVTLGAQLAIEYGYYDGASPISTEAVKLRIDAIEHDPDHGIVTITAASAWGILAAWTATRAIQYAAGVRNIFGIAQDIAARAGLELSASGGSANLSAIYPAFTIPAGTDGLTALRSLLARVPDVLMSRGEFLFITEPLAADSADATLEWKATGTNHPIHGARYTDRAKPNTHVRAVGGAAADIVGESIDYTEGELTYTGPVIVADRELTSAALAAARAAAIARRLEISSRADKVTIPVHCGIETNDVLAITDSRQSLSAAKRRVLAIDTTLDRVRGNRYDQVLTLGEP